LIEFSLSEVAGNTISSICTISFLSSFIYNFETLILAKENFSIFMPEDTMKNNPRKRTKTEININLVVLNIVEFFLIICIVVIFYVTLPVYSTKVIYIPKGSTTSIISYLNKSGYELNAIDNSIIRFLGYPQQGWIDFKTTKMTKADFLYKLVTSKAALVEVTLIPGETYHFFLKDVAKRMRLSEERLFEEYKKYAFKDDGNILAESYSFPLGMSEENLIYYLINYTSRRYEEISRKIFGEYNQQTWYYYISIASVIQKEAASIEEMPMVASVIYNRLTKGMPLQMDGTLNYGIYSHDKVTAARIREDKSDYNTYLNKGIPPHPVSAVSIHAIKAAVFPSKTNYLYFVKDNSTNVHRFAGTYQEHVYNIKNNPKVAVPINVEIKPETKQAIKAVSKPEQTTVQTSEEPKTEPTRVQAKVEPKVEVKTQAKVEVKTEPKVQPKAEFTRESVYEPKTEVKRESVYVPKVESRVQAKPQPKPKAETRNKEISIFDSISKDEKPVIIQDGWKKTH